MSKTKRAAALLLALCSAFLCACGAGEAQTPASSASPSSQAPAASTSAGTSGPAAQSPYVYEKTDETVDVEFWLSGMMELQQPLLDEFNETRGAELNIRVTGTDQGDYWQMMDKINAASVAGTLPNAFIDEVAFTKAFAEDDIITSLQPYIEANNFDAEAFQIGDMGNLHYNGEMYAFPHMRSIPVMYVNKTLAAKAGVDEHGPKTFDEFEEYLKACYDVTGKPAMYMSNTDFWILEAVLYSFDGKATMTLTEDETDSNINGESSVAMVSFLRGLVEKGYLEMIPPTGMEQFLATLTDPDVALTLSSIAVHKYAMDLATQSGFEVGLEMIPSGGNGVRGVPVGGSSTYLCNTGTENEKAAAFEFLCWLSDAEPAAYLSANTGYMPTKLASFDTEIMEETVAAFPGYQTAFEELEYCIMRPTAGTYREVQDVLVENIYTILTEGPDIQSSLDALAEEVRAILNR